MRGVARAAGCLRLAGPRLPHGEHGCRADAVGGAAERAWHLPGVDACGGLPCLELVGGVRGGGGCSRGRDQSVCAVHPGTQVRTFFFWYFNLELQDVVVIVLG